MASYGMWAALSVFAAGAIGCANIVGIDNLPPATDGDGGGGGCTPDCSGRSCGSDGCGGSCGNCPSGTTCNTVRGTCSGGPCVPSCAGRTCGPDGCGGSCGACSTGETCSSAGACGCGAVTGTTACDQCVAAQCCNEATMAESDANAKGAFGCFQNGTGESVSQICSCLAPYGGPDAYLTSALLLCEFEQCGPVCGAVGVGGTCSAATASECAFGPCVTDNTGATECRQFCCTNGDCPTGHTCLSVTSVSGGSTFVCN